MNTKHDKVYGMTDGELKIKAAEFMGVKKLRGLLLPDYPNDIAAAWKLVKCMADEYKAEIEIGGIGTEWEAEFLIVAEDNCISLARGMSAEQAITRAFIIAMLALEA